MVSGGPTHGGLEHHVVARGRRRSHEAIGGIVCLLIGAASSAQAQMLFDWPVRANALPEAVQTGAPALFWNPAGVSAIAAEQREIWVVHIDGPDASGIQGLAGAGTFDVPWIGRVGVAYQHLGIPDISRTRDSPEPEPGSLTVTEDLAVIGLGRAVAPGIGVGGSLRFLRATVGGEQRERIAADFGVRGQFGGSLRPRVGAAIRSVGTRTDMLVGVVSLIPNPWSQLGVDAGYGFQGSLSHFEPDHRLTLRGTWDGVLVLGAGAQGSRDGQWTALWEFRIDVGRFSLGVVREGLPNDFGAAHFFQATIGLN